MKKSGTIDNNDGSSSGIRPQSTYDFSTNVGIKDRESQDGAGNLWQTILNDVA